MCTYGSMSEPDLSPLCGAGRRTFRLEDAEQHVIGLLFDFSLEGTQTK
jgi:hypothetical protein